MAVMSIPHAAAGSAGGGRDGPGPGVTGPESVNKGGGKIETTPISTPIVENGEATPISTPPDTDFGPTDFGHGREGGCLDLTRRTLAHCGGRPVLAY